MEVVIGLSLLARGLDLYSERLFGAFDINETTLLAGVEVLLGSFLGCLFQVVFLFCRSASLCCRGLARSRGRG